MAQRRNVASAWRVAYRVASAPAGISVAINGNVMSYGVMLGSQRNDRGSVTIVMMASG